MNYFETTRRIIQDAIDSISEEEFSSLIEHCMTTLGNNGKIIVTGLGKNVPICEKFVGTMNSMGIASAFMHTNSAVHGDLGLVRSEDLVIVLTKSGETMESIYLVDLLAQRGCTLWLLSFQPESTLYRKVSHRLMISLEHEGDLWNTLPNHSTTMNLIVLQELAMHLIERLGLTLDVLKQNHPGGAIGLKLQEEL